jgi:methylmalonyl-CoA/ethylmalonyl-CoA epimerase
MIGRLNHVAIAVRDIAKAAEVYKRTLGAEVSETVPPHEHGVSTVFITLPNTKIELIEPLGADSPIAKFLERNPDGGITTSLGSMTSSPPRPPQGRRPRARRRRAQDRRPR